MKLLTAFMYKIIFINLLSQKLDLHFHCEVGHVISGTGQCAY